jgi:hypothetical protein
MRFRGVLCQRLFHTPAARVKPAVSTPRWKSLMLSRIRRSPLLVALIALICIVVVVAIVGVVNRRKFKGQVLRDETVIVELISSDDPEWLTFENNLVRVEVGCDQFREYLQVTATNSGKDTHSQIWREYAQEVQATVAANSNHCSGLSLGEHHTANILELGIGTVYDKRSETEVKTIRMWAYSFICGPLCGRGTRTFYFPDGTQFLEVIDWIS